MTKTNKSIHLVDTLHIKQSAKSCTWHYYFRLNGKQYRKSTKTSDQTEATLIATQAYKDAKEALLKNDGREVISFDKLTKSYLKHCLKDYHRETINRHFYDFWKTFNSICDIKKNHLNDYLEHRTGKNNPTNKTLNRENTVFNQMMQHAYEYDWIPKPVKFKKLQETRRRREHFTKSEYDQLIRLSRKRVNEYDLKNFNGQLKGLRTTTYWRRALMHDLIIILANTGLRIDEIVHVTWSDIDLEQKAIKLKGKGKVKSHRKVAIRGDYAIKALQRLKQRRINYRNGKDFSENERIQSLPNGQFIKSMARGFRDLIKECDFLSNSDRSKYVLTSLRHTYATFRLKESTPTRALAKQMGTSERMIEYHYGHDTAEDYWDLRL